MPIPASRLLRGVRTVVRRRGVAYLPGVLREHVPPRIAYRLLCAGGSGALLSATERAWAAGDRLSGAGSPDRVAARLRGVERQLVAAGAPQEGARPFTREDVTPDRTRELDRLLNAIHRTGLTGLRHSLDELVIGNDGRLGFRRLAGLRAGRARGIRFMIERDRDRTAVNARFGTRLLTEAGVRREKEAIRQRLPAGWYRDYAPIDFGGGLSVGMFPSTDSGTGRWAFLNGPVLTPLVSGRRVLDLGSNNGSLPLMMLRAGAREVVAVEQSPVLADAARLYGRVFEWRDMREYAFRVHVGDMREWLTADWGAFDVVTAFCSIYYLPDDDQAAIVRKAAGIGATLVLQANEGATDIPGARTIALQELMARNGYEAAAVHTRDGFARPLLVATPAPRSDPNVMRV